MTLTVPITNDGIVQLPEVYVQKRIEYNPDPVNYVNEELYPVMIEFTTGISNIDYDFLIIFNPSDDPGPDTEIHLIGTDGRLQLPEKSIPETATQVEMKHDAFYVKKDDYYGENILCTFVE